MNLLLVRFLNKKRPSLSKLSEDVILLADTLHPTELLTMDKNHIKAIGLDTGGRTSHVAIFARSLGIPTVLGLGRATVKTNNGDEVIINGNEGRLVIRPEWSVFLEVQQKKKTLVSS